MRKLSSMEFYKNAVDLRRELTDWMMAKAMEKLIVGLQDCEAENVSKFVKDWASDTYNSIGGDIQNRVEKRKRVNEIEEALKEI